jgi:hypothetical protein
VKGPNKESQCFLACFYGHPLPHKRHESWELLAHLKKFCPGAWMVVGDFNEIVNQSDKIGGAQRREGQMVLFRNVLEDCGLSDLGFLGSKFTWSNGHHDDTFMKERLDRAVANQDANSLRSLSSKYTRPFGFHGRRELRLLPPSPFPSIFSSSPILPFLPLLRLPSSLWRPYLPLLRSSMPLLRSYLPL